MKETTVAKQYASALFELALETNQVDQIENDLKTVKDVFSEVDGLEKVLASPKISASRKKELVAAAFSGLSTYVVNTLLLLIDKKRIGNVVEIIEQFIQLSYDHKGVARAVVESTRPLSPEETEVLSSVFAAKIRKNALEIENQINPELLGGIKIQLGNRIYDGSLRGKLNRLKRELISDLSY